MWTFKYLSVAALGNDGSARLLLARPHVVHVVPCACQVPCCTTGQRAFCLPGPMLYVWQGRNLAPTHASYTSSTHTCTHAHGDDVGKQGAHTAAIFGDAECLEFVIFLEFLL